MHSPFTTLPIVIIIFTMVDSSTFGFNKYNFEIKSGFKGVRQKFLKNCYLPSYAIIFGQRTFVSFIKLGF